MPTVPEHRLPSTVPPITADLARQPKAVLLKVIDGLMVSPEGQALLAHEQRRLPWYREQAEWERLRTSRRQIDAAQERLLERIRERAEGPVDGGRELRAQYEELKAAPAGMPVAEHRKERKRHE